MWAPTLNIDYHVAIDHNFYSVPYQLIDESLEARFTASTVEVFFKGRRVAAHARLTGRGRYATQLEHMPRARRMDPVAPDRLGDPDGARDRPAGGRHPRTPAASRTGLPRLS